MGRAPFLCCLSARLATLLFCLCEILCTGFLAAILWLALVRNEERNVIQLSKPLLAGVIALTAISTITAIISFAGFIGTLCKNAVGIRAFATSTTLLLVLQASFSVLYVIAIYVEPKSDFIQQCEAGRTDSSVVDTCTNKMQEVKGITVLIVGVALLVHAYEVYVVGAYVSELDRRDMYQNLILGNTYSTSRHFAGEDSNMAYYADGHLSASFTNALLATAFFRCWHILLFYGVWATAVALINRYVRDFTLQPTLLTVVGMVLGFIISYRTTSSFERYNDGRRFWSQITLANRTFAHTLWFHIPAVNPDGPADTNENKSRVLIEKKTAINLLEAFAVATKHYLRGEDGIFYTDLYHLVKFLPPYALPIARTSTFNSEITLSSNSKHDSYAKATTSPPPGSFMSHKPGMLRRQGSSASSMTMVPAPGTSPKAFIHHRKPSQTPTPATQYFSDTNEEGFLLPARMPPKHSFIDLFPFSLLVRFWANDRKQMNGAQYARLKAKHKIAGAQNIPLEISLYLSSYVAELQHRKVTTVPTANNLLGAINQLGDALTGLDRVLTTPIPFSYSSHLWVVTVLYCLAVPLQIWSTLQWFSIPATILVVFTFFGFLVCGEEIEDPFGYDRNDLNLDHFTSIIRHDLRTLTAVPDPSPSIWAFSPENDMIFASDQQNGERIAPETWVATRGLPQIQMALAY